MPPIPTTAVTDILARCTVGLMCKAFVNLGLCSLTVDGLPTLLRALENPRRNEGQGIITVSNHVSVLDDPLSWAVLPARSYIRSHTTRWTLGASDIMFTNPVFSAFFRSGQVLETFRGDGVYQRSVDVAIEMLNRGAWIHLFPEGKVNQTHTTHEGTPRLSRFKWGIGRIIMETTSPPDIIPMWLSGFDTLMPESRHAPYKYIPCPFQALRVVFGEPLSQSDFKTGLIECARRATLPHHAGGRDHLDHLDPRIDTASRKFNNNDDGRPGSIAPWIKGELHQNGIHLGDEHAGNNGFSNYGDECGDDRGRRSHHRVAHLNVDTMRSEVTALIQRHVEALGKRVLAESEQSSSGS